MIGRTLATRFNFSTTLKEVPRSVFKDTIYALATGWGKSAIAVIRVSGPDATQALKLAGPNPDFQPRQAYFRTFHDIFDNKPIDQGILLVYKGPKSFTGEDLVEL
jgi:tRNA modification GTPase